MISIWERHNKIMGIGFLRGFDDLIRARVWFPVTDILENSPGKQVNVLLDDADIPSQGTQGDFLDIDAIQEYSTLANFIETGNERAQGRFANTRRPHDGNCLSSRRF